MPWYPKTKRVRAGVYQVYAGETFVQVMRVGMVPKKTSVWAAMPHHTMIDKKFRTKAAAIEWAGEWLKEHA